MDLLLKAREIYFDNVSEYQRICVLHKTFLNHSKRFCIGEHCKPVFCVEIKLDGDGSWGATPKVFYNRDEAEKEIERLKQIYHFVSECRVVTRKGKE